MGGLPRGGMASEVGQMMKFAHIVDEVFAGHVEHLARAHNAAELLALSVNVQRLSSLIQHSKCVHSGLHNRILPRMARGSAAR